MTTTGHCLCRAIAYAYDGPPNWTIYCHCESCRRATSSPVTAWISVPRASFRFTRGTPVAFASSDGVRRGFCGTCGSPLSYENDHLPDEVHIYAASLADPSAARPMRHVFAQEQLPWHEVHDTLPRYATTMQGGKAVPMRHGPARIIAAALVP